MTALSIVQQDVVDVESCWSGLGQMLKPRENGKARCHVPQPIAARLFCTFRNRSILYLGFSPLSHQLYRVFRRISEYTVLM
jgi:hypothetical protein